MARLLSLNLSKPFFFCSWFATAPLQLAITTDFDRTLTSGKSCSSHGVLEGSTTLTKYREILGETKANTAKYLPIEIDPALTIEQKLPHMREWYVARSCARARGGRSLVIFAVFRPSVFASSLWLILGHRASSSLFPSPPPPFSPPRPGMR